MSNINMPSVPVNDHLEDTLRMELRDSDFQTLSAVSILISSGVLVTATFFISNEDFLKL